MSATTRWKDNETTNIDRAIELLVDSVENDDRESKTRRENWEIKKVFDENKKITLFGNKIEYNMIRFSYNRITTYNDEVNDIPQNGFVIVYLNNQTINYIIDKNSDAKSVLRILLSYTGKNEIDDNKLHFENDFFFWLINRVYYANNTIEIAEENNFELQSIKGFSGDTEDSQTKVSASGESVMNIISTLAFLLESRNFNQIKLDLNYTDHSNVSLALQKGTVNVLMNEYSGIFEDDTPEEKIAKAYLLIYLEILPILFQEYYTDIGNDVWNEEVYKQFLKSVGETIREKIDNRIASFDDQDN